MKKNNITITILIILVILLGLGVLYNNQKTHEALKEQQDILNQLASSTPDANTTTSPSNSGTTGGTNTTAAYPKAYTLALGGTFNLADGTQITLSDLSDSRCPTDKNIQCFVAGAVVAELTAKKATSTPKTLRLSYPGDATTHTIVYGEYKISFTNVNLDKGVQAYPTARKNYKLTFTVSK